MTIFSADSPFFVKTKFSTSLYLSMVTSDGGAPAFSKRDLTASSRFLSSQGTELKSSLICSAVENLRLEFCAPIETAATNTRAARSDVRRKLEDPRFFDLLL